MNASEKQISVFVSSTCYDLAQVRDDLHAFITSMGYTPVMSEHDRFPVDPDASNIQNCLAAVRDHANLFVLIVGGRYGNVGDNGKSITNMEDTEARLKGIPRYIFVRKDILHMLPVWKKNRTANFSDVCDSPKLFEFVESLHDKSDHWVFGFEGAEDILSALKHQWAQLFAASLSIRRRMIESQHPESVLALRGEALRLAIERPKAWEYRLFSRLLCDAIKSGKRQKWDAEFGVSTGESIVCEAPAEIMRLLASKMQDARRMGDSLGTLFNEVLPVGFGPPGQPGDSERIIYAAHRIGDVYLALLKWGVEFKRIVVPPTFARLVSLTSSMANNAIRELEEYSDKLANGLTDVLKRLDAGETNIEFALICKLTTPDDVMKAHHEEMESLERKFGVA